MRILHLSDFHYKKDEKNNASQKLLIKKLCESLQNEKNIDFLFFTGDLVFSGDDKEVFFEAYDNFLVEVGKAINIKKEDIIICPGNHDVDRSTVSRPVKDHIRRINTIDELDKFVLENKPTEFGLSIMPTENYRDFSRRLYGAGEKNRKDKIYDLFSIHLRVKDNKRIGIITINTAWCSSGKDDKDNLFFPKCELEKAVNMLNVRGADWKILLLHHPLTDLREFNRLEIEDTIYSEFHFLFSGHLHKRDDFVKLTMDDGIFGTYSSAAFTKKENGKIGYSILDVDFETLDIQITKFFYDHEEKIFMSPNPMTFNLPCNQEKTERIKIYKTLKKRCKEINERANELLISVKDNSKDFMDFFVDPVLKNQPDIQVKNSVKSSSRIDFQTLYGHNNYIIYGKDKTGKTALLYKLTIDLLSKFNQINEIPFYLDFDDHKKNPQKLNILKKISHFLELNTANTEKFLHKNRVKILIDNYDPSNEILSKKIEEFYTSYPRASYIISSNQTLYRSYQKFDYGISHYKTLFIHDISRKEIRTLTEKWPNIPTEKREEFVDRIIDVLKQHNMPFNYWTLSIFLLIFSGKNTLNFNNNSELLELYIDDLLDRNSLASNSQSRFSYQNYRDYLSELAHTLITEHSNSNYTIKYAELISFTEDFMRQNPRRVGTVSEVVSYLLSRGVLKHIGDDNITFRLNGVFEYFIALSFTERQQFLHDILSDDSIYLSFKNEFEIYSGFNRNEDENRKFLETIHKKTGEAFKEINNRMVGDLDVRLHNSMQKNDLLDLTQPIALLADQETLSPLTHEEKDELFDDTFTLQNREVGVKPKRIYDVSVKDFEILETYLVINSRVFKNIENIRDSKYIEDIFNFLINASCNLGFLLLEELEESIETNSEELDSKSPHKLLITLLNSHLPSVVQSFIHSAMGHVSLEAIILKNIEKYKGSARKNQYMLFILHCLLLDIDLTRYKNNIDTLIDISKMGVIRTSVLLKMLMLLLFKSFDDDEMINYLREKIRKVNLIINPKISMREFDRSFEKTRKILLLKRQTDN